jgi:hypothetical protein
MIPCENLFLEVQALREDTVWFVLDKDTLNGPAVLAPAEWEESKEFEWVKINRAYHNLGGAGADGGSQFPWSDAWPGDKYAKFNDDSSITLYYRPQESQGNECRYTVNEFYCEGLDANTGAQLSYELTLQRSGLGKDEEGIPEWEVQKDDVGDNYFTWVRAVEGQETLGGQPVKEITEDGKFPWNYGNSLDLDTPEGTWPDQFMSLVPGWDVDGTTATPRSLLKDFPELEQEDDDIYYNRNHPEYLGALPVYFEPEPLFIDGEYKRWEDLHNNGFPLVLRSTEFWTETYMFLPKDMVIPPSFDQPAYQPTLFPQRANDTPNILSGRDTQFTLSTIAFRGEIPEYQNLNISMICDNDENPIVEVKDLNYEELTDRFNYTWKGFVPHNTNALQVVVDWEFGSSSGQLVEELLVIHYAQGLGQYPEGVHPNFNEHVLSLDPDIWFGDQLETREQRFVTNFGSEDTGSGDGSSLWQWIPNAETANSDGAGGFYGVIRDSDQGTMDLLLRNTQTYQPVIEHPWLGSWWGGDCWRDGPIGPQPPAGSGTTLYFHYKGPVHNVGPFPWFTDATLTRYWRGDPENGQFEGRSEWNESKDIYSRMRRLGTEFKEELDYSNQADMDVDGYHTVIMTVDQSYQTNFCDTTKTVWLYNYDWTNDSYFIAVPDIPQSLMFLEDIWTSHNTELLAFGAWRREMSRVEIESETQLLKRDLPPAPDELPKTLEEIEAWFESIRPTTFEVGESPSGAYTFVLNLSPLDGEVDLLEGVGAPEKGYEWIDVLTDASQINIDRGFDIDQGVLGVPFVGTLVATIQDTNLNIADTKEIKIASKVRLRAGNTTVWTGILNTLEYDWNPGKSPVLFLESWDGVALLNAALMRPRDYEKYDARIKAAAAALGLPVRVYPAVDGDYRDLTPVDDDLTGLQQVIRALDSEGSAAWVDKDGMLNATTREWYKNAVEATAAPLVLGNTTDFTDNPSVMGGYANAYCLSDFTYENSTRKVINGLVLANETQEEESGLDDLGNPIIVKNGVRTNWDFRDENSERIYGSASIRLNTNLPEDTGALSEYADYIFNTFGLPRERIRNVEFPVDRFEDLTIPDEIGLDIGEGVDILIQAPDGRVVMDKIHVISQVRHRITPTEWLMQLELI